MIFLFAGLLLALIVSWFGLARTSIGITLLSIAGAVGVFIHHVTDPVQISL